MTMSSRSLPHFLGSRLWAPEHLTPREAGWRRRIYEGVFPRLWPLLAERLAPSNEWGRYRGREALERTHAAAEALALVTPTADQVRFLAALERPYRDALGPVVRGCRCASCGPARVARRVQTAVPRARRVRAAFVEAVTLHAQIVLSRPNDYDRAHGLLALDWTQAGAGLPWRGLPLHDTGSGLGVEQEPAWLGRDDVRNGLSRQDLALYQGVLRRAWTLAVSHLPNRGCRRAGYDDAEIQRLLGPVSLHLASAELTLAEQRAFLEATGAIEGDWEHLFDAEDPCACQERRWEGVADVGEAYCPRCLSRVFVAALVDELRFTFKQGQPQDRALGAPRRRVGRSLPAAIAAG